MPIRLAVPNEIVPGERRIALEPGVAKRLMDMGVEVSMERVQPFLLTSLMRLLKV